MGDAPPSDPSVQCARPQPEDVLRERNQTLIRSNQPGGWQLAEFLGQAPSEAQRWQNEGMPVTREGRFVYASPDDLTAWVGTELGEKERIHISREGEDLIADLKQGLSFVRQQQKKRKS
jgi:hypothetical protein